MIDWNDLYSTWFYHDNDSNSGSFNGDNDNNNNNNNSDNGDGNEYDDNNDIENDNDNKSNNNDENLLYFTFIETGSSCFCYTTASAALSESFSIASGRFTEIKPKRSVLSAKVSYVRYCKICVDTGIDYNVFCRDPKSRFLLLVV